jgi:hypothetical protein
VKHISGYRVTLIKKRLCVQNCLEELNREDTNFAPTVAVQVGLGVTETRGVNLGACFTMRGRRKGMAVGKKAL